MNSFKKSSVPISAIFLIGALSCSHAGNIHPVENDDVEDMIIEGVATATPKYVGRRKVQPAKSKRVESGKKKPIIEKSLPVKK